MKRTLLIALFASVCAFASEEVAHSGGDPLLKWKWINFAILAGGLGFLLAKNLGPFLRERGEGILAGLGQAEARSKEAAARAAEIERKMAGLQGEVDILRRESAEEMRAEAERVKAETVQLLAKVEASAKQEIESAAKSARQELRKYSAELALDLAEKKIAAQMDGATQDRLVNAFVAKVAK